MNRKELKEKKESFKKTLDTVFKELYISVKKLENMSIINEYFIEVSGSNIEEFNRDYNDKIQKRKWNTCGHSYSIYNLGARKVLEESPLFINNGVYTRVIKVREIQVKNTYTEVEYNNELSNYILYDNEFFKMEKTYKDEYNSVYDLAPVHEIDNMFSTIDLIY